MLADVPVGFTGNSSTPAMISTSSLPSEDVVLHWLVHVARRADALTIAPQASASEARRVWLRAEWEFFECVEPGFRTALAAAA